MENMILWSNQIPFYEKILLVFIYDFKDYVWIT